MLSRADITASSNASLFHISLVSVFIPVYIAMWTSILMGTSPFSVFDLKFSRNICIVEIEHGLRRKADKRFEVTMTVKQVS